jgi:4-alpha-glucanotransferase
VQTPNPRRAGVLCHVTSLPGPGPAGVVGDWAWRFLDFLAAARLRVWQVLPLNPPDAHGSPYQSPSLCALAEGLVDWASVLGRRGLGAYAAANARDYEIFLDRHRHWLHDYALFVVAAGEYRGPWWTWPPALRDRDPDALHAFAARRRAALDTVTLRQFVVFRQWQRLRREAADRDIVLFGDMPLYPALASADVWANRPFFQLDAGGHPRHVAGVPPDYFSSTGQLWGNPLYDWQALADAGFDWWVRRVALQIELFDAVRIDHFRGLEAYWAVPADAADARAGRWQPAPGHALLARLAASLPALPLVAEDLGVITPAVEALRDGFDLPGMRVLQFAFSGDPDNPHLPECYPANAIAYTGTHDNDTTLGWYRSLDATARDTVDAYFGGTPDVPWSLIDAVLESAAGTAIVPLQDLLELDSRGRMNVPGRADGNWRWRVDGKRLDSGLAARIRAAVESGGRG